MEIIGVLWLALFSTVNLCLILLYDKNKMKMKSKKLLLISVQPFFAGGMFTFFVIMLQRGSFALAMVLLVIQCVGLLLVVTYVLFIKKIYLHKVK